MITIYMESDKFTNDPLSKMLFIQRNSQVLSLKNKSDILQLIDDNTESNFAYGGKKIFLEHSQKSKDTFINLRVLYHANNTLIDTIYDIVKNRRDNLNTPYTC